MLVCWSSQPTLLTAFISTSSLPSSLPHPCLHPVPAVPSGYHSAPWPLTSFPPTAVTSTSTRLLIVTHNQGLPSTPRTALPQLLILPASPPHMLKLLRGFKSSSSSKPTGDLPAHHSPHWVPWTTLSAVPSSFITTPTFIFHLVEPQHQALHFLHPVPQSAAY